MDETKYDMWNKFHWLKKIDDEAKHMESIGNRVKDSLDMIAANNNLSRYPLSRMNHEEEEKFYEQLEKMKEELNNTLLEIYDCTTRLQGYLISVDEFNGKKKKEE